MRTNLSLIVALIFLASCANNKNRETSLTNSQDSYFRNKFYQKVRFTRPSESMQVGTPKKNIFANKDRSNYYEDVYYQDENGNEAAIYKSQEEANLIERASPNNDARYRGYFKIGNPYHIYGIKYFPQNYDNFEEVGVASWYGDDFHGKETANGEIYNSSDMTAAHRTLPLPSIARVTNLNNGKSVIVRVNDRGPFAKSRVIDVSEKAAEVLGFRDKGTADVKVELLREDTDEMLAKLKIKD